MDVTLTPRFRFLLTLSSYGYWNGGIVRREGIHTADTIHVRAHGRKAFAATDVKSRGAFICCYKCCGRGCNDEGLETHDFRYVACRDQVRIGEDGSMGKKMKDRIVCGRKCSRFYRLLLYTCYFDKYRIIQQNSPQAKVCQRGGNR